jgi:carbamoyl-phosphate synthase large subunit
MGIDIDFPRAFAKSQVAAYGGMRLTGTAFISVADRDKRSIVLPVLRLHQLGYTILATAGTAEVLHRSGISARVVLKVSEGSRNHEPSIVDLIHRGEVDMVINTPSSRSARADGAEIRAAAIGQDKPLFTTIAQLGAAVASLDAVRDGFSVCSLQEYARARARNT